MELGNLVDLADSLSEYIDNDIMDKCYTLLHCIRHFKKAISKGTMNKIRNILMKADSHTFIEIYYRGNILSEKLNMYLNLEEHGAFGISPGSDIIQILDHLLGERRNINALDLGSGNGFSTFIISNSVEHVTGVEMNSDLYEESMNCLLDLSNCHKVDMNRISFMQSDFFDIDFSLFSFIYIYWPFDDKEKSFWEKETSRRLENKIMKEAVPCTIIVALLPGTEEKDLFPQLKSIPLNLDTLLTVVKAYCV
jgi:SAM-dependent methyltransferase